MPPLEPPPAPPSQSPLPRTPPPQPLRPLDPNPVALGAPPRPSQSSPQLSDPVPQRSPPPQPPPSLSPMPASQPPTRGGRPPLAVRRARAAAELMREAMPAFERALAAVSTAPTGRGSYTWQQVDRVRGALATAGGPAEQLAIMTAWCDAALMWGEHDNAAVVAAAGYCPRPEGHPELFELLERSPPAQPPQRPPPSPQPPPQSAPLLFALDAPLHVVPGGFAERPIATPVSYTHLTLPTNREV